MEAPPQIPPGAAPPALFPRETSDSGISESRGRRSSPVATATSDLADSNAFQTRPTAMHDNSTPSSLKNRPSRNPSPDIAAAEKHAAPVTSPSPTPSQKATGSEVLSLMLKHTAGWVMLGVSMMLFGTGFVQGVLLPRIYVCPPHADCPRSFDMNETDATTLVQTLMQYWLKLGMLIAALGLLKLSAYQAWFILMREGNTIESLDHSLGAIRGDLFDAARLVFQRKNRWLSVYVLSHLGVGAAISLIIGLSIRKDKGTRDLTFTYPGIIQFPDNNYTNINTAGQLVAISKVIAWALSNDTSHSLAHRGSLVHPDSRNASVNARAGGPRIKGGLSCAGFNDYNISMDRGAVQYVMNYRGRQYIAKPNASLAVSMTNIGTAVTTYIWAANTTGRLPNATQTSDGVMHMALCTHQVRFVNVTEAAKGVQEIIPSTPGTSSCRSMDPYVCVSDSVGNAVFSWWGGTGTSMFGVSCRGSVIGPLPPSGVPEEDNCPLTEDLWSETVTSMLDGIVQTNPTSTDTTQKLTALVETVNGRRWWLQALIPFLTLLLYGVGLYYTAKLSQGRRILKKLTLAEVIAAAQTEQIRDLVDSGKLGKTTMQYGSRTGFVVPDHPAESTREGKI